jgi:sulfonate transport system permease protein
MIASSPPATNGKDIRKQPSQARLSARLPLSSLTTLRYDSDRMLNAEGSIQPHSLERRPRASSLLRPALGLIVPLALALGWELAVRSGLSSGRLVPPPSVIFSTFADLAATGELQRHASVTLMRVLAGFACGVALGTLAGAITGYSALVHRLIDPSLQGLRAIPSIAWVPLFILWFGIFEASKIILIAVGVFFPVYLGVMGAVLSVDRKIVEVGRVFRLSGAAMVWRILLPAIMPAYVIALRAGLGLGWMFVVAAEFMGASEGLGFLLIDGQQLGKPAQIVAAIVAFALLGKLTDWIVASIAAPFLRWEDAFARR